MSPTATMVTALLAVEHLRQVGHYVRAVAISFARAVVVTLN